MIKQDQSKYAASRPQTAMNQKLTDSATFETKRRERPRNFAEIDSLIMGESLADQEDHSPHQPVQIQIDSDGGMSDSDNIRPHSKRQLTNRPTWAKKSTH